MASEIACWWILFSSVSMLTHWPEAVLSWITMHAYWWIQVLFNSVSRLMQWPELVLSWIKMHYKSSARKWAVISISWQMAISWYCWAVNSLKHSCWIHWFKDLSRIHINALPLLPVEASEKGGRMGERRVLPLIPWEKGVDWVRREIDGEMDGEGQTAWYLYRSARQYHSN